MYSLKLFGEKGNSKYHKEIKVLTEGVTEAGK